MKTLENDNRAKKAGTKIYADLGECIELHLLRVS